MTQNDRVRNRSLSFLLLMVAMVTGCDDPVSGPIGGLIFVVRTTPALSNSKLQQIERIDIVTKEVRVVHSQSADGIETQVTVDTGERLIALRNASADRLVAQYQVPVGFVHQIRVFPKTVTVHLKNGVAIELDSPSANVPSWEQSGWKVAPMNGKPWPIIEDELTGVRGLFEFPKHALHNRGLGYKLKPTILGEEFPVNPPPAEPGVFVDQITVVFRPGTSQEQIDAVNSQIGARILIAPSLSSAYRMKLPPSINLQDAFAFYAAQPEVQGALPATNFALTDLEPSEGSQDNHQLARLPAAWEAVQNATGSVGSRQVRIGIIDSGLNLAAPDLAMNIAINQGEIPQDLDVIDADGDAVISFVDLNDPVNEPVAPTDTNGNGFVDAVDLLADPNWANKKDEDDFDGNAKTFVDDLVGWDFRGIGNNDPSGSDNASACRAGGGHGTCVASVAAAEGDNNLGVAGAVWNASIVPLRAATISDNNIASVPDISFQDAVHYAEIVGIDIVNVSLGWHFTSKEANLSCARGGDSDDNIPEDDLDAGLTLGRNAFRVPPFIDEMGENTSRVLYVFSAGNRAVNLADPEIVFSPASFMKDVLGDNVLIVGAADDANTSSSLSNYGSPVVELYAPGRDWQVVGPDGSLQTFGATSSSAPAVAGSAALVLSAFPELRGNPVALRERLLNASRPTISVEPGGCSARETNQPFLDAFAAVQP